MEFLSRQGSTKLPDHTPWPDFSRSALCVLFSEF